MENDLSMLKAGHVWLPCLTYQGDSENQNEFGATDFGTFSPFNGSVEAVCKVSAHWQVDCPQASTTCMYLLFT
jgi:hypothetical protein